MNATRLEPDDSPWVEQFFELFRSTFDEPTRESDAEIWEELSGRSRLSAEIKVWLDDDRVIGFARSAILPNMSAKWLIHIAVQKAFRGKGIGTEILQAFISESKSPIFVEVEADEKLLDWYGRWGFLEVCPGYWQPALHAHTQPVPLSLFCSKLAADRTETTRQFYRDAWGLGESDPLVVRAIASLPR